LQGKASYQEPSDQIIRSVAAKAEPDGTEN